MTYRVFATQFAPNAGTPSVQVAVPDQCVKFAALGDTATLQSKGCAAGYTTDLDYSVKVVRDNGQSATIPVGDTGPWNIDDNYWDPPSGSRPRRLFTDLPQGTPESQAAFYDNYNNSPNCLNLDKQTPSGHSGGADQYGRCVLNPSGIDLSLNAASQLGLGQGQNEWVTVTFNWESTTGARWHPWDSAGSPPGGLTSAPDAASLSAGRLDVFGRGGDGALWHTWFDGSWHAWESLGGAVSGGPGAVSWSPGRLDVFVRGTDNNLWHRWFANGWSPWESLGRPPGGLSSGVDVSSWAAGRLDVFGRGSDNALWHIWYAGGWSGWESLGGGLAGDPGAVSWANGRIDVAVEGTDNGLWHIWYSAGRWSGFEGLGKPGGSLTSGPDISSWGPGRLDIFGRGKDNSLWDRRFDGQWRVWQNLGGALADAPGAISSTGGQIDVFVRGTDNGTWHRSYS